MIYRTMVLALVASALVLASVGVAVKFYLRSKANLTQKADDGEADKSGGLQGPTNTVEDQNRALRDQLDQLNQRLQNASAAAAAPKEIDKRSPALALFSPVVLDLTRDQDRISIRGFRYTKSAQKAPATLVFELHNAHPGESVEKGYIVVLAKGATGLGAYPNVFNTVGPYLVDFEKGETFQVARFRYVNAQFDADATHFQILIFTRKGELMINTAYEVK